MNYAGSEWLIKDLHYSKPDFVISELGKNVADLLGELFLGIYHLGNKELHKVDWSNKHHIEITIGWKDWSTCDFNYLTRLVLLAHHMAIRVNMTPVKYGYMRLLFHQRNRVGNSMESHPTIDEAIEMFQQYVSVPEYSDYKELNHVN